jgi:hypothetical protein
MLLNVYVLLSCDELIASMIFVVDGFAVDTCFSLQRADPSRGVIVSLQWRRTFSRVSEVHRLMLSTISGGNESKSSLVLAQAASCKAALRNGVSSIHQGSNRG